MKEETKQTKNSFTGKEILELIRLSEEKKQKESKEEEI